MKSLAEKKLIRMKKLLIKINVDGAPEQCRKTIEREIKLLDAEIQLEKIISPNA